MSVSGSELGKALTQGSSSRRLPLSVDEVGPLVASVDFLLILLAAVFSTTSYHYLSGSAFDIDRYVIVGIICYLNFAIILASRGCYRMPALLRLERQARELLLTWTVVLMVCLSAAFSFKVGGEISRGTISLFSVLGAAALIGWRCILFWILSRAVASSWFESKRILLIADEDQLANTNISDQLAGLGMTPSETIAYRSPASKQAAEEVSRRAVEASRVHSLDRIIFLGNWMDNAGIDAIATGLRRIPLPVLLLADTHVTRILNGATFTFANGLPGAEIQRAPLTRAERVAKRACDIALATVGLILSAPLVALAALLIKIESPGPAFFRQIRHGFNGHTFRIVKLRSMTVLEDGPEVRAVARGDSRVTNVGRWIRRTSIDELPQLWNVLRGEMSIVGPRPHAAAHNEEFAQLVAGYAFRHHVKPGLTGWAQVHGLRGEIKSLELLERRTEFDRYYIDNWSIWLDIWIILLTVRLIFRDPAAY